MEYNYFINSTGYIQGEEYYLFILGFGRIKKGKWRGGFKRHIQGEVKCRKWKLPIDYVIIYQKFIQFYFFFFASCCPILSATQPEFSTGLLQSFTADNSLISLPNSFYEGIFVCLSDNYLLLIQLIDTRIFNIQVYLNPKEKVHTSIIFCKRHV